ncbi:unnamed protein product [Mesocestoides corti]|uniref:Tyrosine-protein phosphatase domain-containing protein n=1 Tax=Mesocestoides corti TaxID=53468 RepID=A0A0R3UFP4_MESCO|nr:unnamed protein product [Mesocestoides corti]
MTAHRHARTYATEKGHSSLLQPQHFKRSLYGPPNMRFCLVTITVIITTGLKLIEPVVADNCYGNWISNDKPIAASIKLTFDKRESSIGRRGTFFKWREGRLSNHKLVQFSGAVGTIENEELKLTKIPSAPITLVAGKESYKGNATMQVNVDPRKIATNGSQSVDLRVRSDSPSRKQLISTTSHFRTHRMQETVPAYQSSFCLDNLRAGTTYHVCVAPDDCLNEWNCEAWTTPEVAQQAPLYKLQLNVEWRAANWVQLSWPPPDIRGPATPPIGYIVTAKSSRNCWEKEITLTAPWSTKTENDLVKNTAGHLRSLHACSYWIPSIEEGKLDGYWPDFPGSRKETWASGWNTASVDEQGPVGIFAVTVSNLRANTQYVFEVTPVFNPPLNTQVQSTSVQAATAASDPIDSVIQAQMQLKITAMALSSNLVSLRFTNLSATVYKNEKYMQVAFIVRICKNDNEAECRQSPLYREVVGSYSLYENRTYARLDSQAIQAHLNARVSPTSSTTLVAFVHYYVGGDTEILVSKTKFEARKSNCQSWCMWPAGDWSNTKGTATPAYDKDFFKTGDFGETCQSPCVPAARAIDGESHCLLPRDTLVPCSVPVCNAIGLYFCQSDMLPMTGDRPIFSRYSAPVGCVTNAESKQGTTWISVEWENPREVTASFPDYLILVAPASNKASCKAFINDAGQVERSPFLRNIVRSCHDKSLNKSHRDMKMLNITGLTQDTEYSIWIIPSLPDGRIGSVYAKSEKTTKAGKCTAPCPVNNVNLTRDRNVVRFQWQTMKSGSCGPPARLIVFANESRKDVEVDGDTKEASLTLDFEHCRKYSLRLEFENSVGITPYSGVLSTEIGYPDIQNEVPSLYYTEKSHKLVARIQSEYRHCAYNYALQWGVLPRLDRCWEGAEYPDGISIPQLTDGLVYNLKVRLQPHGVASKCGNANYSSAWSSTLIVPTEGAKSEVKIHNVTVTAYPQAMDSVDDGDSSCLLPNADASTYGEFRATESKPYSSAGNTTSCIIVIWNVSPSSARSIVGYLLEITQSATGSCRLIWIPCEDCLPGYDLTNAVDEVKTAVSELELQCQGHSTDMLRRAQGMDATLYKSTSRLLLGLQSTAQDNGSFSGVVRIHAVKLASIHQILEQFWQTDSHVILSNAGIKAGTIFGVLFVVLAIVLATLLIVRNRRRRVIVKDQYMSMADEDQIENNDDSTNIIQKRLPMFLPKIPTPLKLSEFVETVNAFAEDGYTVLRNEFKTLQKHAAVQQDEMCLTMEVGSHPENRLRNRYRNIIPFDQNRLKLSNACALSDFGVEDSEASKNDDVALTAVSDYVNASCIPTQPPHLAIGPAHGRQPDTYIAAQAPKECTVGLFWQAVWDTNVRLIVMLTR